jgi:hypothetical protein
MTKIGVDPKPLDYIDDGAVQRILEALGPKVSVSNVDKEDLAAELAWHVAIYTGAVILADRALKKDRERRMTVIRNATNQIIRVSNNDVWRMISRVQNLKEARHRSDPDKFRPNPYREEPLATMKRLIEDIGHWFDPHFLRIPSPPGNTWGTRPSRSPFEDLVVRLSDVFRKEFGLEPTFHRRASDNAPDSPFIRFVEQSLAEFRITNRRRPYSRESIAKALTDARTARVRRKPKGRDIGQK